MVVTPFFLVSACSLSEAPLQELSMVAAPHLLPLQRLHRDGSSAKATFSQRGLPILTHGPNAGKRG